MGWVTEFPQCLAPCGRRNWGSHDHKHLEALAKGGVCTQSGGGRKEVKNQKEMDTLKSQFSGWQIELCVYREEDALSSHPPWIFTQKSREQTKKKTDQQRKCLFTVKTDFKAPVLNPASSRDLTKEDLTQEWPHGQIRAAAVSLNEPLVAHHTLKKNFLNITEPSWIYFPEPQSRKSPEIKSWGYSTAVASARAPQHEEESGVRISFWGAPGWV